MKIEKGRSVRVFYLNLIYLSFPLCAKKKRRVSVCVLSLFQGIHPDFFVEVQLFDLLRRATPNNLHVCISLGLEKTDVDKPSCSA